MITISDDALYMLKQFLNCDFLVQGHTDNIPISNSNNSFNWDLSIDRALHFMKILLLNQKPTSRSLNPSQILTHKLKSSSFDKIYFFFKSPYFLYTSFVLLNSTILGEENYLEKII